LSNPYEWDELVPEDWPTPFTQVPTWLLFAACSAQAYRMYAFLAQHVYSAQQRDPKQRIACPKQTAIARVLRLKNPSQVGPYGRELERLGALRIEEFRYAGSMRRGYRYHLRFNPPAAHHGPVGLGSFYRAFPDLDSQMSIERRAAAAATDHGGTEISTSGGTENSIARGTENRTLRGATDSTSQGATDGTSHGPTGSTSHGPTEDTSHPSMDRGARASLNRSAKEEASLEANPSPPPPVRTAEDARAEDKQKGAASPRDLSAATAGGAAGASPTGGPVVAKSAPTGDLDPASVARARDIVVGLPMWLQPGDREERFLATQSIAAKLAEGYPPSVIRRELHGSPEEQVRSKPAFIAARLRKMGPWVPPARPAEDTAALDEIRHRQAAQAGTAPPKSAAAARAAFEASRGRRPGTTTQQQEAGGGEAGS
jgi:hypothetical protein